MEVKFKKLLEQAVIPTYSKPGDAGLDITATDDGIVSIKNDYREYGTGLSIEIPPGYVGLLFPRSSISNYDVYLTNAVGVLDYNYRGEIRFRFRTTGVTPVIYRRGERIGQLIIIPYPTIEPVETNELSPSTRGSQGFGSSGA